MVVVASHSVTAFARLQTATRNTPKAHNAARVPGLLVSTAEMVCNVMALVNLHAASGIERMPVKPWVTGTANRGDCTNAFEPRFHAGVMQSGFELIRSLQLDHIGVCQTAILAFRFQGPQGVS